MPESKNHHYVPRSLLRGFAIPGTEHVHVFDKKAYRVFRAAIANVGAENMYNTVEFKGQRLNAEPLFDEHDAKLAELLKKLRREESLACLTEGDRVQLAFAVVVQRLRVRLVRTTIAALPRQLRQAFDEAGVGYSLDSAPDLDADQVKAMSLRMLRNAERFVPAFLEKHWVLHSTTSENPFWISDSPIVTSNPLPWGNDGLESRGVEIAWPISSTLLLSFLCPSLIAKLQSIAPSGAAILCSSPTIPADPGGVLHYNSLQTLQSSRYLYASTEEFPHAREILEENPSARHIETSMMLGGMGEAPPTRMPPGQWLVISGSHTYYCCAVDNWFESENRRIVTVTPGYEVELRNAIADSPHESIQLFDNAGPSWMMKMIELGIHPQDPCTVVVTHHGPPL